MAPKVSVTLLLVGIGRTAVAATPALVYGQGTADDISAEKVGPTR